MRRLGIRAMVTLHHVTLPRWLAARGGWLARDVASLFARYAEECIRRLGGSVDHWVTINEPASVAGAAYVSRYWPPALGSVRAGLRALGAMLESHAAAYGAMKRVHPAASVGIVLSTPRFEPARTGSRMDRLICAAQDWVFIGSLLRALRTGTLLPPLSGPARPPGLRRSLDFLGVNYYGQYAVRFDPLLHERLFGRHVQEPTVRAGECDWGQISPDGLTRQLVRLSAMEVPLYVTENGIHDATDAIRPAFLTGHVAAVREAIGHGADVRGYFHWSLVDNFEWAEGWQPRFGLIEVDPVTQKRTLRPSAHLYARICGSNGATARSPEHAMT
jgi:beta-glucosidase